MGPRHILQAKVNNVKEIMAKQAKRQQTLRFEELGGCVYNA